MTQKQLTEKNQGNECFDCGVTEWNADHRFKKIKDGDGTFFYVCGSCEYAITSEYKNAFKGVTE